MNVWSNLEWKWKLPILVIGLQLVFMVLWPRLFPSSTSDWVKLTYVVVGYPFLGPWMIPVIWLMSLFLIGVALDRKFPKPSRG